MSTFYGMIEGNRSCATRGGSKSSGFRASAQSYSGSVITSLHYNENDELVVEVGTNDGSSCYINDKQFRGTLKEFNDLLQLANDIEAGKVSVVRHRAKSNRMLKLERAFRD